MDAFAQYVSLGDSMSIDLYPALDAGATDASVALERDPAAGYVAPIGAASLLLRNDEARWPDAREDDLSRRYPGVAFLGLASSGATIGDVFSEQLALLPESDDPTLVTLTIGSEDIFSAFASNPRRRLLDRIVADLTEAYDVLLSAIRTARPRSLVLLTTVCDPSDRMGRIPGILDNVGVLPLSALDAINGHLRRIASSAAGVALADAYLSFLGHGASVPESDRWYWHRSPLEPNARGAHELRRVWLATLCRVVGQFTRPSGAGRGPALQ